jgi:hypothetical protein
MEQEAKAAPIVLLVEPGYINQRDWRAAKRAGIVVLEVPPDRARLTRAGADIPPETMLAAAIKAIDGDRISGSQDRFVRLLVESLRPTKVAEA